MGEQETEAPCLMPKTGDTRTQGPGHELTHEAGGARLAGWAEGGASLGDRSPIEVAPVDDGVL